MKFKVLLRKRGGARVARAESSFWRPDLSMVHAFYVFDLSCFMTRRSGGSLVSWWSCQLIDPSGWGVGGMAGHAGPPVGPASDVVLPLHSLKKLERSDLIGGTGGEAKGGWAGP